MKAEFINPFLNAIDNAMETMMGITLTRDKPYRKEGKITNGDITGIIGFADKNLSGSVALSFPQETILKIYEAMMGAPADESNGEVNDVVGELTNIVVGGAKVEFANLGYPYNIGLPIVVEGKNHTINHKHNNPIIVFPFSFENKKFSMEISVILTN